MDSMKFFMRNAFYLFALLIATIFETGCKEELDGSPDAGKKTEIQST
jgi:hypothetical protein